MDSTTVSSQNNKALGVAKQTLPLLFVGLGVILITIVVAHLVVPEEHRQGKFLLSILALVGAEAMLFLQPLGWIFRGQKIRTVLPFDFGMGVVLWIYAVGVLLLCLLATVDAISFHFLLGTHLVWFVFLLVLTGAFTAGGQMIERQQQERTQQRAPFAAFKGRWLDVADRVAALGLGEDLHTLVAKVGEEVHYATSESLPGSESVDAELESLLDDVESAVETLESPSPEGEVESLQITIQTHVKKLGQVLKRRERLMMQLR